MNESELLDLATAMQTMTEEEQQAHLTALETMPSAEDLASVTNLIADLQAQGEDVVEAEAVCETEEA